MRTRAKMNVPLHLHDAHRPTLNPEEGVSDEESVVALLSSMSHEFRAPLNAILGFAQLLVKDESISAVARRRASGIERAGGHLLHLVNEFLEMSLIESGEVSVHRSVVDLPRLLDEVIEIFRHEAHAKGIRISLRIAPDTPAQVISDPLKVRQILINLVSNAVKFTQQGGVLVLAGAGDPLGDYCSLDLQVMDTGPGIDPEDEELVFRRFGRGRAASSAEGAGLGLAISRHHARLLGGELSLQSTLGRGSIFQLSLPVTWVRFDSNPPAHTPSLDLVQASSGILESGYGSVSGGVGPQDLAEAGVSSIALGELLSAAKGGDHDLLCELLPMVQNETLRYRMAQLAQAYRYPELIEMLKQIEQEIPARTLS